MDARTGVIASGRRRLVVGALALSLSLCAMLTACASGSAATPPAAPTTIAAATLTPGGPPTPTSTPLPGAGNLAGATDICASPINVATTLPAEIPPYNAQLRIAQSNNGDSVYGYCASASVDAIATFYTEQLPGKGWRNIQTFTNNATRNLIATRGGENLTITVSPDVMQSGKADLLIIVNGQ